MNNKETLPFNGIRFFKNLFLYKMLKKGGS